jgi:SAM-dependent methyltransferase
MMEAKLRALDPETRGLIAGEDERSHFQDMDLGDVGLQYLVRSFTIDRIRFIRDALSTWVRDPVVDLGDTNGIFLRSLKQGGISVNISDPAVRSLHRRGIEAVKADVEFLPFKDGSIEVVLLFETLEHLPNPIRALGEIGRVCSSSLILSIPLVGQTTIHGSRYDPTRPVTQHHIFEFSVQDFKQILTHTPFELERDHIATVLGGSGSIADRITIALWSIFREKDMFCGCFRRFYLCHLIRTGRARAAYEQKG